MGRFFKAFFVTLLILVILFVGSTAFILTKLGGESPKAILDGLKENNDGFTFLLMGADKLDIDNKKGSRTDTIILAKFDYKTGKINLVSIPRDTRTNIDGRKYKEKLNHSFNYGGSELTLKTVNEILGTNIEYYMTMDYEFVKECVEAVGGVEVDVPIDMEYTDEWDDPPLVINIKKGLQTLDGNNAIGFLRFRHGYKDADLGRVVAQRAFVTSFLNTLKTPKGILGVPKILNAYKNHTKTNIPFERLVELGKNITKSDLSNIETTTLPGEPRYINKTSYFIHDRDESRKLMERLGVE